MEWERLNKMEIYEYHKMYKDGKIDSYKLADLLKLEYTEIGAYIMSNGLNQVALFDFQKDVLTWALSSNLKRDKD